MEIWQVKLERLFSLLPTAGGVAGVTLGLVLLILCFVWPNVRWLCLAVFLWTATIFEPVAIEMGFLDLVWPLSAIRAVNVILGTALLLVLVLPALVADRGWRRTVVPAALISYFIFQLVFCVHDAIQDGSTKSLLQIALYTIQFVVLAVGVGRWLQTDEDVRRLIWSIAAAAILFCLACTAQALVNHNVMIWNSRFMGTTGNAQHAGQIIGITIPVLFYVLAAKMGSALVRIAVVVVLGLMCVYLAWTGSRTALLIGGTGTIPLFRFRLGRLAGVGIATAAAVAIGVSLFGSNVEKAERLLDTTDTRSVAWQAMLHDFLSHPLFGTPASEVDYAFSENSYLSAAAGRGLVGLIPLLVTVALLVRQAVQLQSVRSLRPDYALLVDLITGCFASALLGAFFDGFLLGQFNLIVFCIFLMSTAGTYLLDVVSVEHPLYERLEPEAGLMRPAFAHG